MEVTSQVEVVKDGWIERPKELIQVRWEIGKINISRLSEYTLKDKKS